MPKRGKERAIEEKSKLLNNAESAEMLKINPLIYHSEKLVSFSDVAVIYEGNQVCDGVTFQICRGERILIQGKNGSGKSSLLKFAFKISDRTYRNCYEWIRTCHFLCSAGYVTFKRNIDRVC